MPGIRDTIIVLRISCHDDQIVMESGCPDQEVGWVEMRRFS